MTARELERLMVKRFGEDFRDKAIVGPVSVFRLRDVFDEAGLRDPKAPRRDLEPVSLPPQILPLSSMPRYSHRPMDAARAAFASYAATQPRAWFTATTGRGRLDANDADGGAQVGDEADGVTLPNAVQVRPVRLQVAERLEAGQAIELVGRVSGVQEDGGVRVAVVDVYGLGGP